MQYATLPLLIKTSLEAGRLGRVVSMQRGGTGPAVLLPLYGRTHPAMENSGDQRRAFAAEQPQFRLARYRGATAFAVTFGSAQYHVSSDQDRQRTNRRLYN
jgi:hypothetical protein